MPRPTETWEGCRWTRTDPPVNVESSEPTDHQLLFRKKWTVVPNVVVPLAATATFSEVRFPRPNWKAHKNSNFEKVKTSWSNKPNGAQRSIFF